MKTVYIVAEGQAEANFVKRVLTPYFIERNIILIPCTIVTSTDYRCGRIYKGGVVSYSSAWNTIKNCLSTAGASKDCYVTTMIDYYGLPGDTPGIGEVQHYTDPYDRVTHLETAILSASGVDEHLFFPYVQLHEFESLQFVNIDNLAGEYFEYDIEPLRKCLSKQPNPELINDSPETAPSKRIMGCIPNYDKTGAGVDCLVATGLSDLRKKCRHFGEWIDKIEKL